MEIIKVPITEVQNWEKNPRNIRIEDFKRLKAQIVELGVYKPLIAVKENGVYIVLGGNMRLMALQELKVAEVDLSVVEAPTEVLKIKYALSDNDRHGEYDEQQLAELIYPHREEISLAEFKIDLGAPVDLKQILNDFAPDIDPTETGQDLDENLEVGNECPKCGYKW